jgi:predicted NAD/FAD-binding protein
MLVRFWVNHHLLDLFQRPCWRVVKGRSKSYVDKVLAGALWFGAPVCRTHLCWLASAQDRSL